MNVEELQQKALRLRVKTAAYTKIGFGLIVLFAMVGNCSGHRDGAVMTMVITVVIWTSIRIVLETFEAMQVLAYLRKADEIIAAAQKESSARKSSDDDATPPESPL